jgi:hypothetical protein
VGPASGGGFFFLIGHHYYPGTTVTVGGSPATIQSMTPTAILATAPPGAPGPATIVVTSPSGCIAFKCRGVEDERTTGTSGRRGPRRAECRKPINKREHARASGLTRNAGPRGPRIEEGRRGRVKDESQGREWWEPRNADGRGRP